MKRLLLVIIALLLTSTANAARRTCFESHIKNYTPLFERKWNIVSLDDYDCPSPITWQCLRAQTRQSRVDVTTYISVENLPFVR